MFNRGNNSENLLKLKRIAAFLTSLGLIGISIWFSQLGFGIQSSNQYLWVGWFLGIVVTVMELVFNTSVQKLNPTLVAVGVMAYIYGMWTNVSGLGDILPNLPFAIIVGLFVEVVPEPLFAWSIGVHDGGDVLGNIGDLFGFGNAHPQPSTPVRSFHSDTDATPVPFKSPFPSNPPKVKKGKLASPIFNDKYTNKFKRN